MYIEKVNFCISGFSAVYVIFDWQFLYHFVVMSVMSKLSSKHMIDCRLNSSLFCA